MRLLSNVRLELDGIAMPPHMLNAMHVADYFHRQQTGQDIVITSALDGEHSSKSRHYSGLAFDLRTWYFATGIDQGLFINAVRIALGDDYDIVLESDHVHIEHDPER